MTDQELLEYAAKAAGQPFDQGRFESGNWFYYESVGSPPNDHCWTELWNPLTDDGDALRLAVKLSIDFYTGEDDGVAIYAGYFDVKDNYRQKYKVERVSNDPYSATRRAIVRCAAEIGKGMTA